MNSHLHKLALRYTRIKKSIFEHSAAGNKLALASTRTYINSHWKEKGGGGIHYDAKFAWPPAKGVSEPRHQSPILVTVPFGYWTPGTGVQKDTIYRVLRRGVWASSVCDQEWES